MTERKQVEWDHTPLAAAHNLISALQRHQWFPACPAECCPICDNDHDCLSNDFGLVLCRRGGPAEVPSGQSRRLGQPTPFHLLGSFSTAAGKVHVWEAQPLKRNAPGDIVARIRDSFRILASEAENAQSDPFSRDRVIDRVRGLQADLEKITQLVGEHRGLEQREKL